MTTAVLRDRWYLVVVVVAVVTRITYWVVVTPTWTPVADADQYVRLARSLADGSGFQLVYPQMEPHPTAFRPPLYPAVLAPGFALFGDALWPARFLTLVLGAGSALTAGIFARRVAGRLAGLVAGTAVGVYPPLVANDTVTLTEPLAVGLVLGAIVLVDDDRVGLAGAALGALLLTRPNGYLVLAILAIWTWHRWGPRRALLLTGIAVAVIVPWMARNAAQVGTARLTTSDGFTLAAIYNEQAQENGTFTDPVLSSDYDDPRYRLAQFDEAAWNDLLMEEAVQSLADNPTYVFEVVKNNSLGYFEIEPWRNRWAEGQDGRHWRFRQAMLPLYSAATVFGLAGVAVSMHDDRMRVLVAVVLQFVVLSLVLVAPPRLRAPFDVLCCIGLGLFVAWWRVRFPRRKADQALQRTA